MTLVSEFAQVRITPVIPNWVQVCAWANCVVLGLLVASWEPSASVFVRVGLFLAGFLPFACVAALLSLRLWVHVADAGDEVELSTAGFILRRLEISGRVERIKKDQLPLTLKTVNGRGVLFGVDGQRVYGVATVRAAEELADVVGGWRA